MYGLKPETIAQIRRAMAAVPSIEQAILYGSRAKGTYKNGSDIDVTLVGENLSLHSAVYPLMEQLEDLNLPYTFDISILAHITSPELREHIARVGAVFYDRAAMNE